MEFYEGYMGYPKMKWGMASLSAEKWKWEWDLLVRPKSSG